MAPSRLVDALIACVAASGTAPGSPAELHAVLDELLTRAPRAPSRGALADLDQRLRAACAPADPVVALVFGGATKIKDYVFEAPRLPEIRGASALLDWVNTVGFRDLWRRELGALGLSDEQVKATIIYASGGNMLAVAPAGAGAQALARQIERAYTDWTISAQSVAVAIDVPLISLRYGRDPLAYWVEQFRQDWADPQLHPLLEDAYPGDADIDDRFFRRKQFSELVAELAAAFYRRREQRAADSPSLPPSFYPLSPWDARCVSSTIRPALYRGSLDEDEPAALDLSAPAARRRFVGQVVKRDVQQEWYDRAFGWARPEQLPEGGWAAWSDQIVSWEQHWQTWLQNGGADSRYARLIATTPKVLAPNDVHEIGAAGGRYIGMIYADGNRVGSWMEQCATPDDYRDRSNALDAATRDAVFQALGAHLEPVEVRRPRGRTVIHPFEIITIGGDDILLIVPGPLTLSIAYAIAHAFERNSRLILAGTQATGQPLPDRYRAGPVEADPPVAPVFLSAGVVIAREDTPIFFLRDLVDQLLKSAKAHARERQQVGAVGGSVDLLALKSISMVTNQIKEYRQLALGQERKRPDAATRRMTARPYTWHELDGLIQTIRQLKQEGVPRSQLYRIREVLDETRANGVIAGALEYLYTRSRLRPDHRAALLNAVELAWGSAESGDTLGSSAPPWLRRAVPGVADAGWETIWPDLVEFYDFVAAPPQEVP